MRSRAILRHPAKGSTIQCPHVTETEVCNPTVNCDQPIWEWLAGVEDEYEWFEGGRKLNRESKSDGMNDGN